MNEIEQKTIEEMARDFTKFEITTKCGIGVLAERFYNLGYRNCKDKVVLDKEEQERILNATEKRIKQLKKELRQASELKAETIKLAKQETAREIISKAKDLCKELENQYSHLCKSKKECLMETCRYEGVLAVKRGIYEIAKQYGVEVE